MTLEPGSTLGPYRIIAVIGAGGMGEVYRAHDSRLQRDVAIKVLAEHAAGDSDRAVRFEREARAVSGISHPNIATVYDVGREGAIRYFAMELIDGRSLRDEMARPVPLRRLTMLAAGIAQGLARAHQAGIVHRDLKPDNVMISVEGVAKIVDFGLAKATGASAGDLSTATGTLPGSVLGTVAYMSPEQATGAAADFRSDQFSFGTMLYELVAGQHPFRRDSPAQTLAAIIEDDPAALVTAAPKAPLPLRWIIERCLAKSPADRYGSTDDLARDLARVRDHLSDLSGPAAGPSLRTNQRAWVAAAVAVLAIVAAGWPALTTPRDPLPSAPPAWAPVTFNQGWVHTARFVADAQTIVYSAAWDGRPVEVYTTTSSSPESRRLEVGAAGLSGVSKAGELAVSLNCAYDAGTGLCLGTLARVPLLGGAPRPVAEDVLASDWGPDGELAVVRGAADGRYVEYPLGTRVSDVGATHLRFSRDGLRLAWATRSEVFIRERGRPERVSAGWEFISGMTWSPDDRALLVSGVRRPDCLECVVRVAPGEADRAALRGAGRVRVLDAAPTGELLVDQSTQAKPMLAWRAGSTSPTALSWFDGSTPDALSRDGKTVLFTERGSVAMGRTELYPIYVRTTDGGPATRLGTGYGLDLSPDGRWALTLTRPNSGLPQHILLALGAGSPKPLDHDGLQIEGSAGSFIDDGRIIFSARSDSGPARTYSQSVDGGSPVLVAHEPGRVVSPVAPDGNRFISRRGDGSHWVAALDGSPATPLPRAIDASAAWIGWGQDGRAAIVASIVGAGILVEQVDLARGTRTPLRREWAPLGRPSAARILTSWVKIARDGSVLLSGETDRSSTTYVVTGVR